MSVSKFKKGSFNFIFNEFLGSIFLKFETPQGIADLTASTVSDAMMETHRQL
jgi:hypothetical protein